MFVVFEMLAVEMLFCARISMVGWFICSKLFINSVNYSQLRCLLTKFDFCSSSVTILERLYERATGGKYKHCCDNRCLFGSALSLLKKELSIILDSPKVSNASKISFIYFQLYCPKMQRLPYWISPKLLKSSIDLLLIKKRFINSY